jgi:hypothetical protein
VLQFNFQAFNGQSGDWLLPFMIVYSLTWLLVLATILQRSDLDPVTRLTWVVVVIFVPLFGILLYWCVGPKTAVRKIDPSNPLSGTPWETDSGYTIKGKHS